MISLRRGTFRGFAATTAAIAGFFTIACDDSPGVTEPRTGDLTIAVTTTGATIDVDPDGYTVAVDGRISQAIAANFALLVANLASGNHTVLLAGLASNCSVDGDNPRSIEVRGGSRSPTSISFVVSCKANTGSIQVSAVTSGPDPDPTGYVLVVGGARANITANGTRSISDVREGSYELLLSDVAGNCVVESPNPLRVNVAFGSTTQAAFTIRCVKQAGLDVTITTTGVDLDPDGYIIEVRTETQGSTLPRYLSATTNGTAAVTGLLPGIYVMTLTGVMANCDVAANRRTVTVTAEATTPFAFEVACSAPGRIAFVHYTNNADIHVVSSNGGVSLRITDPAPLESEVDPAWSPDGNRIAFAGSIPGDYEIYVMNADGTNKARLTTGSGADLQPAWSPDGLCIAFMSRRDGDAEIHVMNSDGTNQVRLTNRNGYDANPVWSPDGGRIAFESDRLGGGGIWIMNANGTAAAPLPGSVSGDRGPAWSPDGSKIAFARQVSSSRSAIFIMNVDGSNVTRLSGDLDIADDPAWSSDGRKIAFAGLETYDYYTAYWPQIVVIGLDGIPYSSPTTLTGISPAWRPR